MIKYLTWAMPSSSRLWRGGSGQKELPQGKWIMIRPSARRRIAAQTLYHHSKKSQHQNLPPTFPADTWHIFTNSLNAKLMHATEQHDYCSSCPVPLNIASFTAAFRHLAQEPWYVTTVQCRIKLHQHRAAALLIKILLHLEEATLRSPVTSMDTSHEPQHYNIIMLSAYMHRANPHLQA